MSDKFELAELEITISQKHIDQGVVADCTKCPAALALLEQVPDTEAVDVDDSRIVFTTIFGQKVQVEVPQELENFVIRFDARQPVQPLTFKIHNPLCL